MPEQRIIDETRVLQMHEGHAQALLNLWNDGLIDLDYVADPPHRHSIESALETLCDILDRSIRNRNQQIEHINNEPMDRFRRREVK